MGPTSTSLEMPVELPFNSPEELLAKGNNIVVSKGPRKLPFEFVRSSDKVQADVPLVTAFNPAWFVSRFESLLSDPHIGLIWLPFAPCIEHQTAADLADVRLVVTAIQGTNFLHFIHV